MSDELFITEDHLLRLIDVPPRAQAGSELQIMVDLQKAGLVRYDGEFWHRTPAGHTAVGMLAEHLTKWLRGD